MVVGDRQIRHDEGQVSKGCVSSANMTYEVQVLSSILLVRVYQLAKNNLN